MDYNGGFPNMYPPYENQMQYFPPHLNPMTSLPYPNRSSNSFDTSHSQSWAGPTPHMPPMPPSHSFGMNHSGIPGMPNITDNPNPYQSSLPPLRGQSSNHSSHYNSATGPRASPLSTPPSQRESSQPSPEASRRAMPPSETPRYPPHQQSTSPQKLPSAESSCKRKRGTSSVPANDVDTDTESESNDDFSHRIRDAIDTPVHSPSGSNLMEDASVSETGNLDHQESQESSTAVSSTNPSSAHSDISAERMEIIAHRLHLTPEEIAETSFVYSLSNPNEQRWAQIGLMMRHHQDGQNNLNHSANGSTLGSTLSTKWEASDDLRTEVRKLVSKVIIQIEIQSYTGRTPKGTEPEKMSLDNITLYQLRKLANKHEFYAAALPSGFIDRKPGASSAPLALIKTTAIQVRADLRKELLVNIIGKPKDQPVPHLKALVGNVTRFRRRDDRRSDDEIWNITPADLAYRYALLRLIGIKFEQAPSKPGSDSDPRPKSMWTWVDNILRWFAKLSSPSRARYQDLVIETDRKLFNGTRTFAAIMETHKDDMILPDENEWEANKN